MAKSEEPTTNEATAAEAPSTPRDNRPLTIAGVVVGSVLAVGLVFGGGVVVGAHLLHVDGPGMEQGQLYGPPGAPPQGGPRDGGPRGNGGERSHPDDQPSDGSTETPSN